MVALILLLNIPDAVTRSRNVNKGINFKTRPKGTTKNCQKLKIKSTITVEIAKSELVIVFQFLAESFPINSMFLGPKTEES